MKNNLSRVPGLHYERIENQVGIGTPDLNLCYQGAEAWVELKRLDAFPKRAATPVRINHFTVEQKLWLRRRGEAGGRAWLFVQVGQEYFLFDWGEAQCVCSYTQAEWRENYRASWKGRCNWSEWLRVVTEG